jgi:DNA-binding CsgD family transcriptional regulator
MPRPERGVGQGTFFMPLAGGSLSVLGSTLFFLGIPMNPLGTELNPGAHATVDKSVDVPSPLTAAEWGEVVFRLRFTHQQSRIVHHLLGGLHDKQIASALSLSVPTVRTHLRRLSAKIGVTDRVELLLRIFRIVCELRAPKEVIHHK